MDTGLSEEPIQTDLPVIQRPIDNTALSAYMTCPREYNFAYRQHRRQEGTSPPLSFGSFWHLIMEAHYKTGGDPVAMADLPMKWEGHDREDDYRTLSRALMEYKNYKKYLQRGIGIETDLLQTVGYPDHPMVELSTAVKGGQLLHPYAGKIDRIVVEDSGLAYVEDHKTTSRLDRHYFNQWVNSNQMMGYTWIAQQLMPHLKIQGVRINLLHITKTKSEFHRRPIPFTPKQIEHWEENVNEWLKRLERDTAEDNFPGHYGTNGCSRKYGMCDYYKVCSSSPSIRQAYLEDEFPINPWNPLEVEDEEMSEDA